MKRTFRKYPSNKVYASTSDKYNVVLTGDQICTIEDVLVEFIQSNNLREESRLVKDARLILGQLRDEYDEYLYPYDDDDDDDDDEEYNEEDDDEDEGEFQYSEEDFKNLG